MITTADNLQAIGLAVEAEDRGVSVEQLALVNDVRSERVVALARQLREVLGELHRELHRIGATQGFTPQEVDQVFHERLAAMMPKPKRAQ
jgi:chromosome segregation and condensation protein ScpB